MLINLISLINAILALFRLFGRLLIYWSGVRVPPGVQIRKFNGFYVKIPSKN